MDIHEWISLMDILGDPWGGHLEVSYVVVPKHDFATLAGLKWVSSGSGQCSARGGSISYHRDKSG